MHPLNNLPRTLILVIGAVVSLLGCTTDILPGVKSDTDRATDKIRPPPRSGFEFQSAETQRLQEDLFANPGMLWVDSGEQLWQQRDTQDSQSCKDCHGDATTSMRGVATTFPKFNNDVADIVNIEGQISHCREARQQQTSYAYESSELLALTAYITFQSRGIPMQSAMITPGQEQTQAQNRSTRAAFERGKRYYHQRRGQLNLSCNQCHEDYVGQMLRGDLLSEGHSNGYPTYRLEWQTLGSLQRRLRFCNVGVRAEPFAYGAQEYIDLELYLAWRATSLPMEAPSIRR